MFHKNRKFCLSKDTVKGIKRQLQSEGKYLQVVFSAITISRICKDVPKLNDKKTANPTEKWAIYLKDTSSVKIQGWQISTEKDAQPQELSGKCTQKAQ